MGEWLPQYPQYLFAGVECAEVPRSAPVMTGSPPLSHYGLHSQPDLVSYHACGAAVIWVHVLCTWCCVRHANLRPSKSKWKSKQTQKRMRHGVCGS